MLTICTKTKQLLWLWQSGKTSSPNISIPIQNLSAGTYMVLVKDEKESVVMKMMKE